MSLLLMQSYEMPRLPWSYLPIGALLLILLGQMAVLVAGSVARRGLAPGGGPAHVSVVALKNALMLALTLEILCAAF